MHVSSLIDAKTYPYLHTYLSQSTYTCTYTPKSVNYIYFVQLMQGPTPIDVPLSMYMLTLIDIRIYLNQ